MTPDRSSGSTPAPQPCTTARTAAWHRPGHSRAVSGCRSTRPPHRGQRQGGGLRNGPRLECLSAPSTRPARKCYGRQAGAGSPRTAGGRQSILQIAHGFDNGHNRLDGVAVDDRPVLSALLLRVAILVDDPGSQGAGLGCTRHGDPQWASGATGACSSYFRQEETASEPLGEGGG